MKLSVFSTKPYDKRFLDRAYADVPNTNKIEITYHEVPLDTETVSLVAGADAVCVFVNDVLSSHVILELAQRGVKAILLRCAGFNHVDLKEAEKAGIMVANVPSYSPEAVAEFAVALIQTINRKTHKAFNRVREGNFALDGLMGRTLYGKTVGIVGTGKIGVATARIMKGFGCRIIAYDPYPSDSFRSQLGDYMELDHFLPECDIVSLHCPLVEATRHIINERTISLMKPDALLVNTSRGGLIDTKAVIQALKNKSVGSVALDVYEGEGGLFYNDHSDDAISDDVLARLLTFPNVIVSGHQAFFTQEALTEIAETTLRNLVEFEASGICANSLTKSSQGSEAANNLPVRNV